MLFKKNIFLLEYSGKVVILIIPFWCWEQKQMAISSPQMLGIVLGSIISRHKKRG